MTSSTQPALWWLDSSEQSIVLLGEGASVPRLVWLGERLSDGLDAISLAAAQSPALAHATLDNPAEATIFPVLASGHGGPPALRAHRGGCAFGHSPKLRSVQSGDAELVVELLDEAMGLSISLSIALDRASGLCRWSTRLCNCGDSDLQVDWLAAASLSLPADFCECEHFGGRWGQELMRQRSQIDRAPLLIESWRGRTGHQSYPGVVVGEQGFGCHSGQTWVVQMGWGGNHRIHLQRDENGLPVLQFGVNFHPGECRVEPGGELETPSVYIATGVGRDRASQRMHTYARRSLLPRWTRTPRPVHCNSWEAVYFDHRTDTLDALIEASAAAGAERFVLDDGWFSARRDDTAGLGDWWVDRSVYPDGLHPVVDKVRACGMQFGLWFEPEMVNPDSQLYRAHSEWALRLSGLETPLARNQLALDLSRPEVCDYLFDKISVLVDEYAIDYIKWDMNRDLVLPGDGERAVAMRQPHAVLKLMRRLNARFPRLEIESCSSGGGRLDWGLLSVCGRVWPSDNIDPIERARIQADASVFLPREVLGSHVGQERAHLSGRRTTLSTRAIVALGGQYGFELDLRHLDAREAETLRHYTALYKTNRGWLSEAIHWTVTSLPDCVLGEAQVAADQSRAMITLVVCRSPARATPGLVKCPGLDPAMQYRIRVANHNLDDIRPFNRSLPVWCERGIRLTGSVLGNIGLTLPVMPAQSALVLLLEQDA